MKILLINYNPVVSRLLALCTRDENIVLEEVKHVDNIQHEHYDIVFVDEDSYESAIWKLENRLTANKIIFLSHTKSVKNYDFDIVIEKPFLPSQIISIFDTMNQKSEVSETLQKHSIFPLTTENNDKEKLEEDNEDLSVSNKIVENQNKIDTQVLDTDELEKIKMLLNLNDEAVENEEELDEEEIEKRKIEVIKEQLIADGLEIVEEDDIVNELSNKEKEVIFIAENEQSIKNEIITQSKKKRKKKKKKEKMAFTKKELESIEDAIQVAIVMLKKKQMKKLLKGKKVDITVKLENKK